MRNFCGGILEQNPPFNAQLIKINGYYGTKNLYCRWNALNDIPYKPIILNFTKYFSDISNIYSLEINYINGKTSTYNLQTKSFSVVLENVDNIYFHYFTNELTQDIPFTTKFDIEVTFYAQNLLGLYISLATIVFICLMCSFLFYKCSRIIIHNSNMRSRERSMRVNMEVIENQVNNVHRVEEDVINENLEMLKYLFQTELRPIKYDSSSNEFSSNCTICLEDYKLNDSVTKLLCKHLFHTKCLKNWCEKIILNPKCPNCNESIIPTAVDEEEKNNAEILTLNRNSRRHADYIENNSEESDVIRPRIGLSLRNHIHNNLNNRIESSRLINNPNNRDPENVEINNISDLNIENNQQIAQNNSLRIEQETVRNNFIANQHLSL
jgi:hypothetical protein